MIKYTDQQIETLIEKLDFSKLEGGLIPIIAQDNITREVLMLAFANKEAVKKSLQTGHAHYYSRSRNTLWKKGEISGHVQIIEKVLIDCDRDCLLFKIKQEGAACHKGYYSCFYREFKKGELVKIREQLFDPKKVYGK
ncbi:MAG: phosphoribosyl-AMP cyclohydrolase [Promethearchaeota archaeon]